MFWQSLVKIYQSLDNNYSILPSSDVLLTKGLTEDELIIIVALAAAVLALLLVIAIILCIYCTRRGKDDKSLFGSDKSLNLIFTF